MSLVIVELAISRDYRTRLAVTYLTSIEPSEIHGHSLGERSRIFMTVTKHNEMRLYEGMAVDRAW
jgi:hypothetical protein